MSRVPELSYTAKLSFTHKIAEKYEEEVLKVPNFRM
jgi:phosphoribosyl-ATP pyrophosphohydrolase